MDQSFCPKNSAESYPKSTSTRYFEEIKNFTPAIVARTKLILFHFSGFKFLLITKEP